MAALRARVDRSTAKYLAATGGSGMGHGSGNSGAQGEEQPAPAEAAAAAAAVAELAGAAASWGGAKPVLQEAADRDPATGGRLFREGVGLVARAHAWLGAIVLTYFALVFFSSSFCVRVGRQRATEGL